MDTFPIVERKDIARTRVKGDLGEIIEEGRYITKDAVLEIYDEMGGAYPQAEGGGDMNENRFKQQTILRFNVLVYAEDRSKNNRRAIILREQVAEALGVAPDDLISTLQYLEGEGLIEFSVGVDSFIITHLGVLEVEEALTNPEDSTKHFLPVAEVRNEIIIHGNVIGSQLNQQSPGSNQSIALQIQNSQEIGNLLITLEESLEELTLTETELREARSEIATLRAQIQSPRPKRSIVAEGLSSLRSICEGAMGSGLATAAIANLDRITSLLGI